MNKIEREKSRIKKTGEVFTPLEEIEIILDQMDQKLFEDENVTFMDPSCGTGRFLKAVIDRKQKNGIDFETALRTVYGVDLMNDNVEYCKEKLLNGQKQFRHIVDKNIVCADALEYHFRFDGTLTDAEEHEKMMNSLFEF